MRRSLETLALVLVGLAAAAIVAADDLTGQQLLLCTPVQVTVCTEDGDCVVDNPWNLNIPQFVEVNLKEKKLSTTKASGENRSTPIRTVLRENGSIYLQGIEAGRAFSFVISEETGMLSVAVARDDKTVSIFGACTPMQAAK
jgi:hypothetical protein